MFSRPKILFLVSLLFVALLNPKFNPYLPFKFLIFYHSIIIANTSRITKWKNISDFACNFQIFSFINYPLCYIARSAGTVLLKTNLLEVFEDHLFVLHLEPLPADELKQVKILNTSVVLKYVTSNFIIECNQ